MPYLRNSILILLINFSYAKKSLSDGYLVGAGIYDITGPAAEVGMMGYAQVLQKTKGILQRIYARAFVFQKKDDPHNRLVFVSADLGQLFQSVFLGVLKELKKTFPDDLYNEKNVMISATHSHSGPGGYAHDLLYNLSTLGFNKQNYNAIVNGITHAILRAHNNLKPSKIFMGSGEVLNASFNRSPRAYDLNPLEEREKYKSNVDDKMLLLRMDDSERPFAMLNWFSVHGTSLDNENNLISGDNKGYASSMFERLLNKEFKEDDFVAAFAQGASGDISPNPAGIGGHEYDGLLKMAINGQKQLDEALKIFNSKNLIELDGILDFKQVYVDMSKEEKTCPSAIGISMIAGAGDGPGFGATGITCNNLKEIFSFFSKILDFECNTKKDACHLEKPILLYTGKSNPPLIPQILPIQIFLLDKLSIVGLPFEITTMAARRIRSQVLKDLSSLGIKEVVIAGLSNAYAGYITTREEYKAQEYEGASNQFGPYSLDAILKILNDLAKHFLNKTDAISKVKPLDLSSSSQITLQTPVIFDSPPLGGKFGDIDIDVKPKIYASEEASVTFFGAHLNNNLLTNDSFLFVEKKEGDNWVPIFFDRDIETTLKWERLGLSASKVTILWRIPKNTKGLFRIRHKGFYKDIAQQIKPYEGISSVFEVIP